MASATLRQTTPPGQTAPCVDKGSGPMTVDAAVEGKVDTVDSNARYLAYLARIRPILLPATRYLAYTSDVGEAFRPNVAPRLVTAAYGISWLYLGGDVAYEGYKAHLDHRNALRLGTPADQMASETTDVGLRVAKRAIFQSTASMLFPALTIHSAVKYSAKHVWSKSTRPRFKAWGPTLTGLSIVPALPFIFDEPIEHAVDWAWQYVDAAVRPQPGGQAKLPEKEL